MNKLTKGIIGVAGATAIGVGAYFGFNGNEPTIQEISTEITTADSLKIDEFDENYFANYNKNFISDTDDSKFNPEGGLGFHTWAWQKYLHLTQNIKNEKGEKTKDGLPLFLDVETILQITPNGEKVERNGAPIILQDFHQAGSNHPILTSNKYFGDGQNDYTVFYSIHMNEIMHGQMVKSTNSVIQELGDQIHEKVININDSISEYRNGALELKAAWINVKAISQNIEKYLVVNEVPMLKESVVKRIDKELRDNEQKISVLKSEIEKASDEVKNAKVKELNDLVDNPIYSPIASDYETVNVALIGLHVVGKVSGFPELLWATFEGQDLAPDNLNNLTDWNSKQTHSFQPIKGLTAKTDNQFMFYEAGILSNNDADKAIEFDSISKNGDPKYKVYRKYPLGVSMDSLKAVKYKTHLDLENALNSKALANEQIKQYYNGNIWLGVLDEKETRIQDVYNQLAKNNKKLAGSPNATNVSMESFKQSINCFSCHSGKNNFSGKYYINKDGTLQNEKTVNYNSTLNVSHIYTAYFKSELGKKLYPNATQEEVNAANEYFNTLNEQKLEATFK